MSTGPETDNNSLDNWLIWIIFVCFLVSSGSFLKCAVSFDPRIRVYTTKLCKCRMGRASKLFPEKTARFTLHISSFERKGEKTKNLMFCRTRVNNLHIDVSSSSCHFARAIWRVHSRIHMTNDGKRMKLLIIFFFFWSALPFESVLFRYICEWCQRIDRIRRE